MKKLMFAIAAVAAGSALADVTSANIVGYNTREMSPDFLIMSVPWGSCEDGVANLNKVFSFDGDASYEVNWAGKPAQRMVNVKDKAPEIQVMNAQGGYAIYYYVKKAHLKDGVTEKAGWCNSNGVYADAENSEAMPGNVPVGYGFWIRGLEGGDFTMTLKY